MTIEGIFLTYACDMATADCLRYGYREYIVNYMVVTVAECVLLPEKPCTK